MTDTSQTFLFRVLSGERYCSGSLVPPKYEYVTIDNPDADFRRMMAYKTINYLKKDTSGHINPHIIRVDHLTQDALAKILEYDYRKYRN